MRINQAEKGESLPAAPETEFNHFAIILFERIWTLTTHQRYKEYL